MKALQSQLVLGFIVLWTAACIAAASEISSDGGGNIWMPTPEHPLPVSLVVKYNNSGNGGLNNILWMVVKAAAMGCSKTVQHQEMRAATGQGFPLAFGVVILPPIKSELNNGQDGEMHQYSEIFDLEHQQHFYIKHRNCYMTDQVNFDRLQREGSLQVFEGVERVFPKTKRGPWTGPEQHHVYQGLELSTRLLERAYEPCIAKMRRIFHHGESFYTAVHMRVEDDWAVYCKKNERPKTSEKFVKWCFGADEIANITLATEEVQGHHNFLLIYAADNFDPTHKSRTPDNMKTDPTTVWPPHVKTANPIHMGCFDQAPGAKPLSYTERSAVSMFLAADADTFIGTPKSTFFLGVTMIRGLSRPFAGHSYTYDGDAPEYKHAHLYSVKKKKKLSFWPEDA